MKYKFGYNVLILLCLALATLTVSCRDEIIVPEGENPQPPEEITKGFSISFTVTLDQMGGPETRAVKNDYLTEIENYINLEMFRVLFFNSKNEFLFESKSRWVTQTSELAGENQWHVSVPVFSYGNDDENYEWDKIREDLTSGKFKIAILANRPTDIRYWDYDDMGLDNGVFNYNFPRWDSKDSWKKTIFDLHHCADDPVYRAKSKDTGCYDFIMDSQSEAGKDFMGPVYMCMTKETKDAKGHYDLPSKNNPIPMYGVQEFEPLVGWQPGTTFNVSKLEGLYTDYPTKSIFLLRSLVRLELLIPKSLNMKPTDIVLKYSNVYARTEPMDVATPTEKLWANDQRDCEWENLLNYGLVFGSNDITSTKAYFQRRYAWFYGVWKEWGWDFTRGGKNTAWQNNFLTIDSKGMPSPRIFNPIIQRNSVVFVDDRALVDDDIYYRYVVYTGERNTNDPSSLIKLGTDDEINNIFWAISFDNQRTCYCLPICDYSSETNPINGETYYPDTYQDAAKTKIDKHAYTQVHIGPYDVTYSKPNASDGRGYNGYKSWGADVFTDKANPIKEYYMMPVRSATKKEDYPWPLLRNHVYRLTIRSVNGRTGNENINGMVVESERRASPTIVFN